MILDYLYADSGHLVEYGGLRGYNRSHMLVGWFVIPNEIAIICDLHVMRISVCNSKVLFSRIVRLDLLTHDKLLLDLPNDGCTYVTIFKTDGTYGVH